MKDCDTHKVDVPWVLCLWRLTQDCRIIDILIPHNFLCFVSEKHCSLERRTDLVSTKMKFGSVPLWDNHSMKILKSKMEK